MPTMGWHRNNGNDYDNDDDNGSFSNGSQKGATCAMLEIAIHAIHVELHFGRPMQQRGRSHISHPVPSRSDSLILNQRGKCFFYVRLCFICPPASPQPQIMMANLHCGRAALI